MLTEDTLRQIVSEMRALVVHWHTCEYGMHSLEPMPDDKQAKWPTWGWVKAYQVKKLADELESAILGQDGASPPLIGTWPKDSLQAQRGGSSHRRAASGRAIETRRKPKRYPLPKVEA